MYESFFKLHAKPFSLLPDPGFVFFSRAHQEALTILEYGLLNQAGFIVLTGEIGVGKTTLMRCLLNRLSDNVSVGLISNTHQLVEGWMAWVCSSFGIKTDGLNNVGLHEAFVDFVIDQYSKGKRTLLIVDEAQNLGSESLEELRLLSNINSGNDLILQLMLLGQPQLRDLLRRPELQQFVQRVAASYHLGSLDAVDTERYIRHRISVAGGRDEIFTADACEAVFGYSGGVPRLINLICDTALVYAYAAGTRTVTAAVIDEFVEAQGPHLLIPLKRPTEARRRRARRAEADSGSTHPAAPVGKAQSAVESAAQGGPARALVDPQPDPRKGHVAPSLAEVFEGGPAIFEGGGSGDSSNETSTSGPAETVGTVDGPTSQARTASPARRPAIVGLQKAAATGSDRSTAAEARGHGEGRGIAMSNRPGDPLTAAASSDGTPITGVSRWLGLGLGASVLGLLALAWIGFGGSERRVALHSQAGAELGADTVESEDAAERHSDDDRSALHTDTRGPGKHRPEADDRVSSAPVAAGLTRRATEPQEPRPGVLTPPAEADPSVEDLQDTLPNVAGSDAASAAPTLVGARVVGAADTQQASDAGQPPMVAGVPAGIAADPARGADRPASFAEDLSLGSDAVPAAPVAGVADQASSSQLAMQKLERELRGLALPVEWTNPNRLVVDLGERVTFTAGSVALDAEATAFLGTLAEALKQSVSTQIRVVGHTDHQGRSDVNQRLSERRAEAVARFLRGRGLPEKHLRHEGRGDTEPKVDLVEERRLGPSVNRRIELELAQLPSADVNGDP